LIYFREHLLKNFARTVRTKAAETEMRIALQAAALAYEPKSYEGEVLLLLASERPPHVDFLPGWQAVVSRNLHAQYVEGHHRDFLEGKNARSVADAIVSHLMSATEEKLVSCCADTRRQRPHEQKANPREFRLDEH
jgi:thioesterase domain-containing protein